MRFTPDVARGDWILPRLRGWGVVGGVVPRGFEAYARILHPVPAHVPSVDAEVPPETLQWSEVAARSSRLPRAVVHPLVQWTSISGAPGDSVTLADGREAGPPGDGALDPAAWSALAHHLGRRTAAPDLLTAGVWNGYGELRPGRSSQLFLAVDEGVPTPDELERAHAHAKTELVASVDPEITSAADDGPLLELPGRDYVLLDATTDELVDGSWTRTSGLGWYRGLPGASPNLLWPADRAWSVASEIDFDSTLVGGTRALVEEILADEALEAFEVTEDDDLTWTGDAVNRVPGGE
ncbi:hypothetical protein GCM10023221_23380 [Luteimicrobium xylanilyticum]|uniref:Uncharacterized protein n=1 Tax=Luteimicrobium xylanilyticum TaxID=1133546 RepID=A0A5P9Q5S5_9MICO|nr:hypothetical protein [Luteimicrobium xylanilyticum]QFU96731.1 hypothetical protein KDY119_00218 [Luteimicrobium xylanilyticum]